MGGCGGGCGGMWRDLEGCGGMWRDVEGCGVGGELEQVPYTYCHDQDFRSIISVAYLGLINNCQEQNKCKQYQP